MHDAAPTWDPAEPPASSDVKVDAIQSSKDRSYVPPRDPDPAPLPEGVVNRVSRRGLPLGFLARASEDSKQRRRRTESYMGKKIE